MRLHIVNNLFKRVSPTPLSLLIVGLYTVICHATAVLFIAVEASKSLPSAALTYNCVPLLEYTAMSLVAVVVGAMLLYLVLRERK